MKPTKDSNVSSNDVAEEDDTCNDDSNFILSQEESNTFNPDDDLILSQGSELFIDPSPSSPTIPYLLHL